MNIQNFKEKAGIALAKVGFQLRKASPDILMFLGIGGILGGTVLACVATLKAKDQIDESKKVVEDIHAVYADPKLQGQYSKEDHDHDVAVTYLKMAGKVFGLYAPAIGVHILSITGVLASRHIMRERNLGLAAAFATVTQGFKDYRDGVTAKYGKDVDDQIRNHTETRVVEETVLDENGKPKKVKKKVEVSSIKNGSPYAKFFTEGCNGWTDDPEYNMHFLILQQDHATHKLRAEGFLFLNDVYDMLGIPRTREGQFVGWIYKKDDPNWNTYVDFGIYRTNRENNTNFVNGIEPTILLDFNVGGPIIDLFDYDPSHSRLASDETERDMKNSLKEARERIFG